MDEQNGNGTPDQPAKPYIRVEFAGPLSAEITVTMEGCTAPQMWAAAELIKHYADDFYAQQQMQHAAEQMQQMPQIVPAGVGDLAVLNRQQRRARGNNR